MSKIPILFAAAVSKYEAANSALLAFMSDAEYMKVVEQFAQLQAARNSAIEEAKALYKKHHKEIGPKYNDFSASITTAIDAKLLLELLPHAEAAVKIIPESIEIDRDVYKALVKSGDIPPEVVAQVESQGTITVRTPKKI